MIYKPIIIYCYDAYCGWCYGFSPVIKKISETYANLVDFETLSGGMIPKESKHHISKMAGYILGAYKTVETRTGILFGDEYLWHLRHPDLSDWFPDSEMPAIAMAVFRDYFPEKTIAFASDLQQALYEDGRDLTDQEAYRHLLEKYGIPADAFYEKLGQEQYKEKAYYDFSLVKQLQVTGFPAVLMQVDELKFYALAKGYTEYEILKSRIDNVLTEIKKPT